MVKCLMLCAGLGHSENPRQRHFNLWSPTESWLTEDVAKRCCREALANRVNVVLDARLSGSSHT